MAVVFVHCLAKPLRRSILRCAQAPATIDFAVDFRGACRERGKLEQSSNRAIVKHENYGKQLGQISDALDVLIKDSNIEHDEAFYQFLELKARIDVIEHNTENTRFEAVLADLKRLRRKDPAGFKNCMGRVAALGHSPVRSLADKKK